MKPLPSIRDVAAAAGVHFTTVSLALRNDPRLKASTRERIQATARQLGYRPNPLVAALMENVRTRKGRLRPQVIAFCTHWQSGEGWRQIDTHRRFFEGARTRAETLGYRLDHFNLAEAGYNPDRWSRIFLARGIRGIVLASFQTLVSELALNWAEFSAVRIDPNPKNPHLDTVCSNQSQITRVAFLQARSRGYRRIALFVHKLVDERLGDAFLAGYLLEQDKLPLAQRLTPFRTTEDWTAEAFAAWFAKARPDVLLALGADVATQWMRGLGRKVPREVGVIDLDQRDEEGRIAGMRKNHFMLGATAVDMVVSKMQQNEVGVPDFPKLIMVGGRWIEGRSVRPLPPIAADPSVLFG
jgi:LacI family transcriptional regulator